MNFLNGLLAFSVTMIVMSTVVAAIVEFMHDIFKNRQRYMRAYLLNFFDTQLVPMLHQQVAAQAHKLYENTPPELLSKDKWAAIKEAVQFAKTNWVWLLLATVVFVLLWKLQVGMVAVALFVICGAYLFFRRHNEAALAEPFDPAKLDLGIDIDEETRARFNELRQKFVNDIVKINDEAGRRSGKGDSYATRVSATEFASALGRSEVGAMLVETGRDKLDLLITDVLRRFDDTGTTSIAEFQRRSRAYSIIAAFATALFLNVNAVALLDAYFADDDLTARVLALYDEEQLAEAAGALDAVQAAALADYEKNLEQRKTLLQQHADLVAEGEEDTEALKEINNKIQDLNQKISQTVSALTDVGTPIGWQYYPFCVPGGHGEIPQCVGKTEWRKLLEKTTALPASQNHYKPMIWYVTAKAWVEERRDGLQTWLLSVLLSGVLIGLGGPFWFDFYKRLSMLTQLTRNLGLSNMTLKSGADNTSEEVVDKDPLTKHAPQSAVQAFKDAAQAKVMLEVGPMPRRLLNDDGT